MQAAESQARIARQIPQNVVGKALQYFGLGSP